MPINRRDALIGGALACAGAAGLALRPSSGGHPPYQGDLNKDLPDIVGPWQVRDGANAVLPPEDALSEQIYDQIAAKRYVADALPAITLVLAYGVAQSYSTQLHRPDVCYPASNFTILEQQPVTLGAGENGLNARMMDAQRAQREDTVLYWTRMGDSFPDSLWEQRFVIAQEAFARSASDGIVIRLSTTGISAERARESLIKFAEELYNSSPKELRKMLFGSKNISGAEGE